MKLRVLQDADYDSKIKIIYTKWWIQYGGLRNKKVKNLFALYKILYSVTFEDLRMIQKFKFSKSTK